LLIERGKNQLKDFFSRVYKLVSQIPEGKVATYGQIALLLGEPRSARVVGWAMKAAPKQLNLPCHRVVNRLGEMSPGYVFGSPEVQRAILSSEGITFNKSGCINMKKHIWSGPDNDRS
jgi:methylated-DNA-protein-cysteine methyltransferase-like protein